MTRSCADDDPDRTSIWIGSGRHHPPCTHGRTRPRSELLCGIDCEDDRLVAARAGTVFAIFDLDHPHVLVAYNIVSSIRHDHLHENLGRPRTADGDLIRPALA